MEEIIELDGQAVVRSLEPIEILDEKGIPTGVIGMLDDVVGQGLWCRSTHVWLINPKQEIYIQQRSFKMFNNPGKWGEAGGGYVTKGHTNLETARKEIQEELGLEIQEDKFENLGEIKQIEKRRDGKITRQFVTVYLVEVDFNESDVVHSEHDVIDGKFIYFKDLKNSIDKKTIDFIDHREEIDLVFSFLSKRYL